MSEALKQAVQRHTEGPRAAHADVATAVRGLYLVRRTATSELEHTVLQPLVCLVLQGCKRITIGSGVSSHAAGDMMIVTGNVPTASRIVEASVASPYLALALDLDSAVITDLVMRAPEVHARPSAIDTRDELHDALRRLVLLLDRPDSLAILQDGVIREIHHWLLLGREGPSIRKLGLPNSHAGRIARAVAMLRLDYAKPVHIQRLAAAVGMSRSGFHQHFRAITSLTPLQFQKQLRLIEARRLIVASTKPLGQIAFDVGYESLSQFSREYTRMHGRPPTQDRRLATAASDVAEAPAAPGTARPSSLA